MDELQFEWIREVRIGDLLSDTPSQDCKPGDTLALRCFAEPGQSPSLSMEESDSLRNTIEQRNLSVRVVRIPLQGPVHLGSKDIEHHRLAIEQVSACLDSARRIGAEQLVVEPFVIGPNESAGEVGYEMGLNRLYDALDALRFVAESAGVFLGIVAPYGNGLLSPLEARELIDVHMHTWVGVHLDYHNSAVHGLAADWMRILGRRVLGISVNSGLEALPEAMLKEMNNAGFSGPVVVAI